MLQEHEGNDSLSFYLPEITTVNDFYISPYEVTNKQYREFIDNVLDSILHKLFGYIKGDTRNEWVDYKKNFTVRQAFEKLKDLDHQPLTPFLTEANGVMHADSKRLDYVYKAGNKWLHVLVVPDTVCWHKLYPLSYNDAMPTSYLYHPAYDDYPVVGVSFSQAEAYCHWKTNQLKSAMRNIKGFDITCSLPSLYQWEAAAVSGTLPDSNSEFHSRQSSAINQGRIYQNKPVKANSNHSIEFDCNFFTIEDASGYVIKNAGDDGGVFTMNVNSFNPNVNGLFNMKGNVAEWTLTNGDECYTKIRDLYFDSIRLANPSADILKTPVDSFLKQMQQAKIVKGGGWTSSVFYIQPGAHQFYPPSTQHGAIGFRYIIQLKKETE
ncbi:MAG: SUMF1/EgtB/PvdO family nonheme iron enzyme [Bacteroidota bacterium]